MLNGYLSRPQVKKTYFSTRKAIFIFGGIAKEASVILKKVEFISAESKPIPRTELSKVSSTSAVALQICQIVSQTLASACAKKIT